MITVKLFGLLRLDSGIKELQVEAKDVKQLYNAMLNYSDTFTQKDLEGCTILINGSQGNKRSKLNDGDVVTFMSPVAGG